MSKNKLPSEFSDLFGKKDGFHSIKYLDGMKLKDILEYPSSLQEKVFDSLTEDEYGRQKYRNKSEEKSGSSSSSSDESSSESES